MGKTKTSWQKAWEGCEMDQEAREARRRIKKEKVRKNRNGCRQAIRNGNFEDATVTEWEQLDEKDIR
jgi:hypothetical protein